MDKMPKPTAGDVAHTITKAGISAIPIIGGPTAEFFAVVFEPPIVRRKDEWLRSLAERLKLLEEKIEGFSIGDLSSNEQFITAAMQATTTAIRNHQAEKLEALRNAVLNVALRNEADEDIQQIFLNYIDDFMPWHLRILSFFQNPDDWFRQNKVDKPNIDFGSPLDAWHAAYPELRSYSDLLSQMVKDLYSRGLFGVESLGGTMTKQGIFASRTTDMGNRFLRFISRPKEIG